MGNLVQSKLVQNAEFSESDA
jgi:Aspartyl protease